MSDSYVPPCARAALEYLDHGLAVIPLKPQQKEPDTLYGFHDWTDNPEQVNYWWGCGKWRGDSRSNPDRNVGIVCGKVSGGLIVIDLDLHGDSDGLATLRDWETANGKLPETWTQITGSGGRQVFYRSRREIRPSANAALGVDIRGEGSYVVAPPSLHPCGDYYEWSISPDDCDIANANDAVYAFIDYVRPRKKKGEGERFELPDTIDSDRNDTLFRYASSLRSTGRSSAEISILLHAANEHNCKPPLSEAELMKIVGSVSKYEQGNAAKPHSFDRPDEPADRPGGGVSIFGRPDEPADRIKDETVDKIKTILLNLDEVRDCIKFNRFDSRLHVLGPCIPDVPYSGPHVLENGESVNLRATLERDYGVRNKQKFEDALCGFGYVEGQQYNPMVDVLETLPKVRFPDTELANSAYAPIEISRDGGKTWEKSTAVAGTLTYELLAVEPTSYSCEVERLLFRQLVARALNPGCKADQMFVFIGKQGTGKSTFVKLLSLSQDFFVEGFSNFDNEDLKRISGRLVVEIPELDGFNGKDKNKIKSMITQTTDIYRESYARTPVEHPRTAVFCGTTNDGAFLNDSTGGRRFMLIESKKPMCEVDDRLFNGEGEEMIRQAWAETLALYELWGKKKFLQSLTLPAEVMKEAAQAQEKFSEENPLRAMTLSFLEDALLKGITRVNVKMVFIVGMQYTEFQFANIKKFQQQEVTAALDDAFGWRRMDKKALVKGYGTARAWEYILP